MHYFGQAATQLGEMMVTDTPIDRTKEYEAAHDALGAEGYQQAVFEMWKQQSQAVADYLDMPWYRRWFAIPPWKLVSWGKLPPTG
jgi:hypothetical protein